LWYVGKQLLLN